MKGETSLMTKEEAWKAASSNVKPAAQLLLRACGRLAKMDPNKLDGKEKLMLLDFISVYEYYVRMNKEAIAKAKELENTK